MGIKVITNDVDKWEVYSSFTDSVIAEFNTEVGVKRFLALERIYKAKLKAIEELMCFPRGWTVNDKLQLGSNPEQDKAHLAWFLEIGDSATYEDYYKAIDDRLEELLALNLEETEGGNDYVENKSHL